MMAPDLKDVRKASVRDLKWTHSPSTGENEAATRAQG